MKTVNMAILLGATGKDPEIRTTGGGTMVANFSMATSHRFKQGNEWTEQTEWHNLVAYGKTAEIVRDYVPKGAKIHIRGRIQTRSWDDKDTGKKVYRTEIVIDDLVLLDGRKDGQGAGAGRQQGNRGGGRNQAQQRADDGYDNTEISDDDIPF